MKTAAQIITFLFIFLFAYTGIAKLADFQKFIFQLHRVHFFDGAVKFIAIFIPATEILTALLLIFPKTRQAGLWLSFALMVVFIVYVAKVLAGSSLPCSCGGVMAAMSWIQHLYFNIIFLALAVIALIGNNAYMYTGSKLKTL